MSELSYPIPVEAVSHGADFAGKIMLAQLVAERVDLHTCALVERGNDRWVATVLFTKPGQPARQQIAHIGLSWPLNITSQNEELRHAL